MLNLELANAGSRVKPCHYPDLCGKDAFSSSRSDGVNLALGFNTFSLPKLLRETHLHIFSLRSRRQSKAWGCALSRSIPGFTLSPAFAGWDSTHVFRAKDWVMTRFQPTVDAHNRPASRSDA